MPLYFFISQSTASYREKDTTILNSVCIFLFFLILNSFIHIVIHKQHSICLELFHSGSSVHLLTDTALELFTDPWVNPSSSLSILTKSTWLAALFLRLSFLWEPLLTDFLLTSLSKPQCSLLGAHQFSNLSNCRRVLGPRLFSLIYIYVHLLISILASWVISSRP